MEPYTGPSVPPALRVRRFDRPPAAADFSTNIEPANVPAVFPGAIKDWKAFSNWNPLHGGLDYLQERVGSASVEAMKSSSAPVFYGDLRGHERVSLSFSTFINCCKFYLQTMDSVNGSLVHEDPVVPTILEEACSASLDTPDQYYLAQVPILNTENTEGCPLEVLQEDIQVPMFLARTTLASVNLWMNRARSRSSAHYDPHHNLLCVVAGCKEVVLWPPSACRFLYPMPIYGEASNHSAVNLENPDFSVHLRSKYSKEYSQKVILHSGDALFIPEGWKLGIGIVACSPIGRGFFAGKGTTEDLPENSILTIHPRFIADNLEKNKVLYERVQKLASKHCCSSAQLALSWVLHQGNDVVPIPGTRKIKNMVDNIGSLNVPLSEEDLKEISNAVRAEEVAGSWVYTHAESYTWKYANTPPKVTDIPT